MAYEVVLIGLGQQRNMPVGLYAQDKACRAEEELIKRHRDIPLDERLVEVLQKQVRTLMEGEHPSDVFSHRACDVELYRVVCNVSPETMCRVSRGVFSGL